MTVANGEELDSPAADAGLFQSAQKPYVVEPPAVKRKRAAKARPAQDSAMGPDVEQSTETRGTSEPQVGSITMSGDTSGAPVKPGRKIGFDLETGKPTRGPVRRAADGGLEMREPASSPLDEPRGPDAAVRPRAGDPNVVNARDLDGKPPPPESAEQRRASPSKKKAPMPSGDPTGIPASSSKPIKAKPGNRILTPDLLVKSAEKIEPAKLDSKRFRSLRLAASYVGNPINTLVERLGLDRLRIESENEGARIDRTVMERTFGEPSKGGLDLKALGSWFKDNPEGVQIPRKLREGRALTAAEAALYRSNQVQLDEFMLGRKGAFEGFFQLLNETRDVGLAEGDLGPRYYPRTFKTIGDLVRLRETLPADVIPDIIAGNLQRSRLSSVVPNDVPTDTAAYYVNQIRNRLTVQPEEARLKKVIDRMEAAGRKAEAGVVRSWLKNNVLNTIPDIDVTMRELKIQKILDERFTPRDSFTSSGTLRLPKGEIEIVAQRGTKNISVGKKVVKEPVYEIKVDGKPYALHFNRLELLAQKYAETALDRSPVTRTLDLMNRASAWLTIATNTRSFVRAAIGNTARVVSDAKSIGDLAHGIKQVAQYARGAIPEELVKEWRDVGVLDRTLEQFTGDSLSGKTMSLADYVAFANVWVPDQIAKISSYEMGKRFYARENPEWSAQKVRTAATKYATTVSDLMRRGSRSPVSFHPLWKIFGFLSNAPLRETQQLWAQLSRKQFARAAANVGVRAGALYAVYQLVGDDKPEKALNVLKNLLPWTWIAEGRGAPALSIPLDYAKNVAKAADQALGEPVSAGLMGNKPSNYKQQQEASRKAWPLPVLRNRDAKDFIVSPGR